MAINLKSSAGMSPAPRTLSFMDGSAYDPTTGQQITAPSINAKAGLPSLTTKGGTPPAPTNSGIDTNHSEDPMTKFNLGLLDLLKRAQGFDQTKLYNERNRLALAQTGNSMGSAGSLGIEGLKPGDALAARQNAGDLYKPEINNLTDRIQASSQAINGFKDSINAAKSFGEEYAKFVKPNDDVIKAAQSMLEAGHDPSTEVMNKVGQYIDWGKVAGADKARKAGTQTSTVTERTMTKQGQVVKDALSYLDSHRGSDGFVNPKDYRKYKTDYVVANGTPSDFFQAVPIEAYINPSDQKGDLLQPANVIKQQTEQQGKGRLQELLDKSGGGTDLNKLNFSELLEFQKLVN